MNIYRFYVYFLHRKKKNNIFNKKGKEKNNINLPFRKEVMISNSDFDVDKMIDKLLEVKGTKPGKQVNLPEAEIKALCMAARAIFIDQPILLELEAPLKICGK